MTAADLFNVVICPNHLVKQWADEIKGKASKLKVIFVATIVQLRHVSPEDIQDAGSHLLQLTSTDSSR